MAKEKNNPTKKTSPFQDIIKNLPFHNFETDKILTGLYKNTIELGEDEATKFNANIFADVETGEEVFVTDSYSIAKAIREAKAKFTSLADIVFQIDFLGKTTVKGKPFNQFNIGVCSLEAYQESKID